MIQKVGEVQGQVHPVPAHADCHGCCPGCVHVSDALAHDVSYVARHGEALPLCDEVPDSAFSNRDE